LGLADAGATGDGIAANADGGDRANSVEDLKEKGLCYVQVKITNVERGRVARGRRSFVRGAAVDLGQQYDKVPRVGGNFSFDIDTFIIIIIRCITLGVVCSSIFPSRPTLVYSTPWTSHVCGPRTQLYFWFFMTRGYYPLL
jgi:hypothetical protein